MKMRCVTEQKWEVGPVRGRFWYYVLCISCVRISFVCQTNVDACDVLTRRNGELPGIDKSK